MAINLQKSERRSRNVMSEINVTPFVDVMLVLLIVFMVTAPMLTVGVPVNLPESEADSLPDDREPLTVSINSKERFLYKILKLHLTSLLQNYLQFLKTERTLEFMLEETKTLITVGLWKLWVI